MKVVLNVCYGGFGLSKWALNRMGVNYYSDGYYDADDIRRTDPKLVAVVEEDAKRAADTCAELRVVNVPDEATDWCIDEYDGREYIIYVVDGKLDRIDW